MFRLLLKLQTDIKPTVCASPRCQFIYPELTEMFSSPKKHLQIISHSNSNKVATMQLSN